MLTLAALAVGCSDFTSSGDTLPEADAAELAEVLVETGFVGFEGGAGAPQAVAGAEASPTPFSFTINESGPCEGGGTMAINGSASGNIDAEAGTGQLGYTYTLTPNGCQVTTQSQKTFTITGDPNIEVTGDLDLSQTAFVFEFGYNGRFAWTEANAGEGVCAIDLTANFDMTLDETSGEPTSMTANMQGTVCGYNINRSLSVG
jgi:hypothetical protein